MLKIIGVIVLYSVWTLLDMVNIFLIYDKFFLRERKTGKKVNWLRIALIFLISYIYGFLYSDICYNKVIAFCIYIPYWFKMLLIVWGNFKGRKKDIMLILFYQLLITSISQVVIVLLKSNPMETIYDIYVDDLYQVFTVALITLFLAMMLLLRKNNILKIYFGELSTWQYVLFCMALFVANMLEAQGIMLYPDDMLFKWLSLFNVVAVCIMIGQIVLVRESDVRKGKMIDILDAQIETVIGYHKEITEKETQTKKFRHDIKNHLLVLHSMVEQGENEKAVEYIEKMNGMCKKMTKKYETGNFVGDTLLSVKSVVAKERNTKIVFNGYVPSEDVESVDLVILLSNILDNAIEACEKIDGDKVIYIESILKKNMWVLAVKNPTAKNVRIRRNRIATTKGNKELHGYGIQNIERVVQKYEGQLKLECKNGNFTTQALLLLKKNI